MNIQSPWGFLAISLLGAAMGPAFGQAPPLPANSTLIASGLEGPRGLRFGPDGYLYVAEAGTGGTTSTIGQCVQVPGPPGGPGPDTGGLTARISKISPSGKITTVASGFPSVTIGPNGVNGTIGVADVVFLDGDLYALIGGGGCSHGNPNSPSGIAKVDLKSGSWQLIADIGAWLKTHPSKYESADDFEPDGTLYSVIAVDGRLLTVEPNHGQVISVTKSGAISQVIDISASEGHIVPTSIAARDRSLFVGNLNLFPIDPQWARILTISRSDSDDFDNLPPGLQPARGHRIVSSKAGFTTVVAVDFGPDGLLYALELSDGAGFPTPGLGKVVRVKRSGEIEEVVVGLVVPTGMTFGPDGALYISNFGAAPAGAGQILRVDVSPAW
jgi:glucose/arabinose dehydrogenase